MSVTPATKVTRSRYLLNQYIEKKHFAWFDSVGLIVEEISNFDAKCHWSAKYRSRSLGQGICRVSTSWRSTMQGFVVVGLIVEKIWNLNVNCVKVTGA